MGETRCKNFTGDFGDFFKTKVALEAIRGIKTVKVVVKSFEYIQRKLVCGRRNCKSRHPAV